MGYKEGLTICGVVCFVVFALPLGIASIVISQTQSDQCDYTDLMGINIKQYLLGLGIASVIVVSFIAMCGLATLCSPEIGMGGMVTILIINAVFGFAMFIVGAVILFRSNIQCIQEGSVPVIYALVLWCISASSFFTI